MLDLIEHLARWVQGTAADRLPGPRRAARAPPRLGRRAPQRDLDLARAADRRSRPRAGRRPDAGGEDGGDRRWSPRSPSARAATRSSPRRWSTASRGGDASTPRRCRAPFSPCSPPASTRSTRDERRLLQHAAVVGQKFWQGALEATPAARRDRPRRRARLPSGQGPAGRRAPEPPRRRAGIRVQARPDPRRRLRDAAEGDPQPKALRGRRSSSTSAPGSAREGFVGAGRRALRPRRGARRRGRGRGRRAGTSCSAKALELLEAAGDAAAALYSNAEAFDRYTRGDRALIGSTPGIARADRGEAGRRRPPAGPRRRGDRGLGALPRLPPRAGGSGPSRRPAPQDRRRALAQGRAQRLDRQLPARDRPAQGRAPLHRAGAALRGGRLALHAHRRQHARDLRLREGAAPRRAARRGARRRAAPTGSSAASSAGSATSRRRARTSSARSSSPANPTAARRFGRCSPSATTSRSPRPTTRGRRPPTARRSSSRSGGRRRSLAGRAPRLARPARPLPRRLGGGRERDRGERRRSPSARACTASSASPT